MSGHPVPRPSPAVPARPRRQDPLAQRAQGAGGARAGARRLLRRHRGGSRPRNRARRAAPRAIASGARQAAAGAGLEALVAHASRSASTAFRDTTRRRVGREQTLARARDRHDLRLLRADGAVRPEQTGPGGWWSTWSTSIPAKFEAYAARHAMADALGPCARGRGCWRARKRGWRRAPKRTPAGQRGRSRAVPLSAPAARQRRPTSPRSATASTRAASIRGHARPHPALVEGPGRTSCSPGRWTTRPTSRPRCARSTG